MDEVDSLANRGDYADDHPQEYRRSRHKPIEGGYTDLGRRKCGLDDAGWVPIGGYDAPLTPAGVAAKAVEGFRNGPGDGGAKALFAAQVAEMVNHPAHYNAGAIESIDMIRQCLGEEGFKGFCLGNALKYLQRARFKGTEDTDIAKAIWYLRMYRGDDPRKERT